MRKVLIFGNSGSGKSTLAKALSKSGGLAHLDLDNLAWLPTSPPTRAPIAESEQVIQAFINTHVGWVIEGCYTDLLELARLNANEVIFMDLSVAQCVENAKQRPWEPHKYDSKEAQDANLEMLIDWIKDYENRDGVFSKQSHDRFFENFTGTKTKHISNRNIDHLNKEQA